MNELILDNGTKVKFTDDELRAIIVCDPDDNRMGLDKDKRDLIYIFTNHAGVLETMSHYLDDEALSGISILQYQHQDGQSGYLVKINVTHQDYFRVMGATVTIIKLMLSDNHYGEGSAGSYILEVTKDYEPLYANYVEQKVLYPVIS